jgi:hypothetical protein
MRAQFFLLSTAFVLLSSLFAASAEACTCFTDNFAQGVFEAQAVFHGRVVKVSDGKGHSTTATVEVTRSWKGDVGKRVTVSARPESSLCGFHFDKGAEYVFVAGGSGKKFGTSRCAKSREFYGVPSARNLSELIHEVENSRYEQRVMASSTTKGTGVDPKLLMLTFVSVVAAIGLAMMAFGPGKEG